MDIAIKIWCRLFDCINAPFQLYAGEVWGLHYSRWDKHENSAEISKGVKNNTQQAQTSTAYQSNHSKPNYQTDPNNLFGTETARTPGCDYSVIRP